jgi:hypothetical protein
LHNAAIKPDEEILYKMTLKFLGLESGLEDRIAVASLQLQYQGPLIMNGILKEIDLSQHFKMPLSEERWTLYNWLRRGMAI